MVGAPARVLVVDDDDDVRATLREVLVADGFQVAEAATGDAARGLVETWRPDVVLLDLGLPDIGGLDVLVELTRSSAIPVIVVSGRSGETDRVIGLQLGADDYIVKPFGTRELVARIHVALRRAQRPLAPAGITTAGALTIDEGAHEVTVDGRVVDLTPLEFSLLAFFASAPRQVFTRGQLLQHVWKSTEDWQDDNTVAEHVYRLRRKLAPEDRERWIETVRGVGYRFAAPA